MPFRRAQRSAQCHFTLNKIRELSSGGLLSWALKQGQTEQKRTAPPGLAPLHNQKCSLQGKRSILAEESDEEKLRKEILILHPHWEKRGHLSQQIWGEVPIPAQLSFENNFWVFPAEALWCKQKEQQSDPPPRRKSRESICWLLTQLQDFCAEST